MPNVTRTFLADLWALSKPYWFSEERWAARGGGGRAVDGRLGRYCPEIIA